MYNTIQYVWNNETIYLTNIIREKKIILVKNNTYFVTVVCITCIYFLWLLSSPIPEQVVLIYSKRDSLNA